MKAFYERHGNCAVLEQRWDELICGLEEESTRTSGQGKAGQGQGQQRRKQRGKWESPERERESERAKERESAFNRKNKLGPYFCCTEGWNPARFPLKTAASVG